MKSQKQEKTRPRARFLFQVLNFGCVKFHPFGSTPGSTGIRQLWLYYQDGKENRST